MAGISRLGGKRLVIGGKRKGRRKDVDCIGSERIAG